MKQFGLGVGILHNVVQLSVVISEDSGRAVIVSRELANLGHSLHEGLCELVQTALDQGLDDLEEFLHDHSNTLVTEELAYSAEVMRTDESRVLAVLSAVCQVELLAAPQIVMGHLRGLVSVNGLHEL